MRNKNQRLKIILAVMTACLALLFCSCVKDIPYGDLDVEGRETLFAPAVTTTPVETTEMTSGAEITTSPIEPETTAPQSETTAPDTETTAPETTESFETENPVFTGGFSGLY